MADYIQNQAFSGPHRTLTEYESDVDNDDEFQDLGLAAIGFENRDPVKLTFDQHIEEAVVFCQRISYHTLPKEQKAQYSKEIQDFIKVRQSEWDKTTREGHNMLHYLAYNFNRKPPNYLQWFMARALLKLPHLMGSMDNTKRTPLTIALETRNEVFSWAACKNLTPESLQRFKVPLESECENERESQTCLHMALTCFFTKEETRQKIVKSMCSFVPERMFTVKDQGGRTPLHLAVDYERCCGTQIGIVEELLRSGPQALYIPIQVSGYSSPTLSLYQYHEYTRRKIQSERPWKNYPTRSIQSTVRDKEDKEPQINGLKLDPERDPKLDPKSNIKKVAVKSDKTTSGRTNMGPPPLPKGKLEPVIHRINSMPPGSQGLPTPVQSPSLRPVGHDDPTRYSTASRQDAPDPVLERENERELAAGEISSRLKLEYLRTQAPEAAARYLHLQGEPNKELWFDFGVSKKLIRADFPKHFRHLKFDKVLQYVAFPQIELEGNKQIPDIRYQGKQDLSFFFRWLKKQGVERIIKIIVDDLDTPSHSDEAIENSLKPFNVEILDWRRPDLDPALLSEIGSCLREVNLQWSGRNSVLRSWSEKEGLAMIPTLEVINLIQTEGLESDERTQKYLDAFEKRLHESWPSIKVPKVNRPKTRGGRILMRGQTGEIQPNIQERSVDPHKWMQSMEGFAESFRQITALRETITDQSLQPVKVALIDDGADITHPDLCDMKGQKFPGHSFCYYQDDSTWRVSPYWNSSSGHGTLMARLIHEICPSAIINVIKLETFEAKNSKKLQINPASAVKAIKYAADTDPQIICMSWTIKRPEGSLKKDFDDAIYDALNNKGILLFCAASDQGKSADLTYPYGSHSKSFRIGAAKATGMTAETVGDVQGLDFIFPGHQVVMNNGDDAYSMDLQRFEAHSGSSVANALAAGLAALVIECVRLGVLHSQKTGRVDPNTAINKDDLRKIRQRDHMAHALQSIGTNQNTNNKYIEVWDIFDGIAERLRHNEGSSLDQLDDIAALARHFVKKGVL